MQADGPTMPETWGSSRSRSPSRGQRLAPCGGAYPFMSRQRQHSRAVRRRAARNLQLRDDACVMTPLGPARTCVWDACASARAALRPAAAARGGRHPVGCRASEGDGRSVSCWVIKRHRSDDGADCHRVALARRQLCGGVCVSGAASGLLSLPATECRHAHGHPY